VSQVLQSYDAHGIKAKKATIRLMSWNFEKVVIALK
jgi:hypothetical protein